MVQFPLITHTSSLYAIFFIFTFISLKKVKLPKQTWITDLGVKSFGLYLIHEQIMEAFGRIIYFYAPIIIKYQIIYQPILIASAIAVTLLLMAFVARTPLKQYGKYIFG
jgi:peptidoglycan/LPS O-acetylase OafA/YrhL